MDENLHLLKKLNRRTRFTQFLVWIALFFTAVGIAAGYKNWLRIHEKAKAGLAGVAEIQEQLPNLAQKSQVIKLQNKVDVQLEKYKEQFTGSVKELRHIQDSTQHIADTVYTQIESLTAQQESITPTQQAAPTVQDWSLSEVHFLLQTALQVFKIKQDKAGATKALNLADQLLLKRGDSKLLPLRKQISDDIALISQYQAADISLIFKQVTSLQDALKPKKKQPEEQTLDTEKKEEAATQAPEKEAQNQGESLVSRVKKTINEAVVIRKFDKSLHEEMDKVTQESLYQLLSLRLETLRNLALLGLNKDFHEQIVRIESLLKKYYSNDKFSSLKKQLDTLNSVNLNPEIPDISKSLRLLESITPQS